MGPIAQSINGAPPLSSVVASCPALAAALRGLLAGLVPGTAGRRPPALPLGCHAPPSLAPHAGAKPDRTHPPYTSQTVCITSEEHYRCGGAVYRIEVGSPPYHGVDSSCARAEGPVDCTPTMLTCGSTHGRDEDSRTPSSL
eukprot:6130308-Pyramimonas_sp.AAC.2